MTAKNQYILYLLADKFQLYVPSHPSLLALPFEPKVVRDLDILDKKLFEELLAAFITTNVIPPGDIIIVIGDKASFIKDFTQIPSVNQVSVAAIPVDLAGQAKEFIEHVPFDNVAGTTFSLPNGIRAYATNKDLYDALVKAFEKHGFFVSAVFPGIVFGAAVDSKQSLDAQMITTVFQQANAAHEYNLLGSRPAPVAQPKMMPQTAVIQPQSKPIPDSLEMEIPHPDKKRLVILLGVFTILILVLLVMIILNDPF
ncbi:MAG: hypothetical protein AAB553_08105 [Patescibacteria group bacterium]